MGCTSSRPKDVTYKVFVFEYKYTPDQSQILDQHVPKLQKNCQEINSVRNDIYGSSQNISAETSQSTEGDLFQQLLNAIKAFWISNGGAPNMEYSDKEEEAHKKVFANSVKESDDAVWINIQKYQSNITLGVEKIEKEIEAMGEFEKLVYKPMVEGDEQLKDLNEDQKNEIIAVQNAVAKAIQKAKQLVEEIKNELKAYRDQKFPVEEWNELAKKLTEEQKAQVNAKSLLSSNFEVQEKAQQEATKENGQAAQEGAKTEEKGEPESNGNGQEADEGAKREEKGEPESNGKEAKKEEEGDFAEDGKLKPYNNIIRDQPPPEDDSNVVQAFVVDHKEADE